MTQPTPPGLSQDAMTRLSELQPGRPGSIFTSDLSVNEFLLLRQAGFRPLGLVLGTSVYHVGLQVGERACTATQQESRDHLAESLVVGTAIVPFQHAGGNAPVPPLPVMRLQSGRT